MRNMASNGCRKRSDSKTKRQIDKKETKRQEGKEIEMLCVQWAEWKLKKVVALWVYYSCAAELTFNNKPRSYVATMQ